MTKRILWSLCSLPGLILKSLVWSGSAARQSRFKTVLTIGNENGGLVKDILFSGWVAWRLARRIDCLEKTTKVYNLVSRPFGSRVD